MKQIVLGISVILLLVSSFASSASFSVVGPCAEKPIFTSHTVPLSFKNIGQLTIDQLSKSKLEYIGTENKIDSINGTPVGESALEILSRSEMRAYGWCFYVNGEQPDVYPNEIKMSKEVKSVKWIFGYAHYLNGEWLSMCEPSWKIKPKFICDK